MSKKNKPSWLDSLLGMIERRKTSDRILLRGLFLLSVVAFIFFILEINQNYSSPTPTAGGVLQEGIVGIPRFVNPALALTRADQDAVALLYSGLMRIDAGGHLTPDLAENISLSEDGRVYTINLRKDRRFHDDTPITASDVAYTIELVQNPELKSPLAGNWSDVDVEVLNEYELTITLNEPYAPFMENFTLGIMPKHIWSTLPVEQLPFSQLNTEPVGSGPFAIFKVIRDTSGLISSYQLKPAAKTNLEAVELYFFQNEKQLEEALVADKINATAYLPLESINKYLDQKHIITSPLPRAFGVFFNINKSPALRDIAARKALSEALPRAEIIDNILSGYGVPMTEPMLPQIGTLESTSTSDIAFNENTAKDILTKGKWEQNEAGFWEKTIDGEKVTLSITLKTSNSKLFNDVATILREKWRAIGIEVEVEQYEQADLVQSAIRPREFEALLFGLDMSRTKDLYPFWHSSQKSDPGLNIAQYTNISVDRLLEKSRNTQDKNERNQLLSEVSSAINADNPAVFIFAPSLPYVVSKDIITTPLTDLGKPSDRFMNIKDWYANTETLWPIFQNNELNNNNVN